MHGLKYICDSFEIKLHDFFILVYLICNTPLFKKLVLVFYFSNSLIIHLLKTMEIRTVTEFGNLILISIDFDDFIFPFSP